MRGADNTIPLSLGSDSVNETRGWESVLEVAVFGFQVMFRFMYYITLPHFIKGPFLLWLYQISWLYLKLDSPSKPNESLLKDS